MRSVRMRRTGLIVPRSGLGTTRTVAYPTASARGEATADGASLDNRERMGSAKDAQVVPGNALVTPGCARPTFKEARK